MQFPIILNLKRRKWSSGRNLLFSFAKFHDEHSIYYICITFILCSIYSVYLYALYALHFCVLSHKCIKIRNLSHTRWFVQLIYVKEGTSIFNELWIQHFSTCVRCVALQMKVFQVLRSFWHARSCYAILENEFSFSEKRCNWIYPHFLSYIAKLSKLIYGSCLNSSGSFSITLQYNADFKSTKNAISLTFIIHCHHSCTLYSIIDFDPNSWN